MMVPLQPARRLFGMAHRVPVSVDDSQDPLKRMRAHQIAESLIEDAFEDATKLKAEIITVEIAPQLYAAICGIEANIGEAYLRSSGKDRALKFEYALGEGSREHELVQGRSTGTRRGNHERTPQSPRGDTKAIACDHPSRAGQDNEIALVSQVRRLDPRSCSSVSSFRN